MGIYGDWANRYYESGYNVMPVAGKGKPLIDSFGVYGATGMDEKTFNETVKNSPNANIGLLLGPATGVDMFDFDSLSKDLEEVILSLLPPTPVVRFGAKGWGRFFRNNIKLSSRNKSGGGKIVWEYLTTGRYAIVPPSIHPDTGNKYLWIGEDLLNIKPSDLPIISAGVMAELERQTDLFFSNPIEATGRNSAIWRYAYKSVNDFKSYEDWKMGVFTYDQNKFKRDSWFDDPSERKRKTPTEFLEYQCKSWIKSIRKAKKQYDKIDFVFGMEQELKLPEEGFYFCDTKINRQTGEETEVWRPLYKDMGEFVKEKRELVASDKGCWQYSDGYWQPIDEIGINNYIIGSNEKHITPAHIDNFKKIIKGCCFERAMKFENTELKINLNNGVLNLETKKIEPHSNKYMFKGKIPISYGDNTGCNEWMKFLKFVFKNDQELVDLAQEIFGYCLIGGTPFLHRAFVLYGAGRNGKSTFLDVLRMVLGSNNITSVSLANINKPFSAVMLDGKLANIVEETPSSEINSEVFKAAVGGGVISAARKGYDEYELRVTARFVFACNDMPIFKDKNESLLDRLMFVPFDVYIQEDQRDTQMLSKLTTELPGILDWAMEGANRILASRSIKTPLASANLKLVYREETDPLYTWFKRSISFEKKEQVTSAEVYAWYKADTEINGNYPLGSDKFFKRFKKMLHDDMPKSGIDIDTERRLNIAGKKVRGYDSFSYTGDSRHNLNNGPFSGPGGPRGTGTF